MSLHLAGWVECRNPSSPWYFDEWSPVINLDALLSDEDEAIFKGAAFANRLPEDAKRISTGHGLPEDVSVLVAQEAIQWLAPYHSTWAIWHEVQLSVNREALSRGWRLIMEMVEPLAAHCGNENVRIILWAYVTDYGAMSKRDAASEKVTLNEYIRQSRLHEDRLESMSEILLLILEARFGSLRDDLRDTIESADEATLTMIIQPAATETLEQVRARLGLTN